MRRSAGRARRADGKIVGKIEAALPFALTASQSEALSEIRADLSSDKRMLRLLQGDALPDTKNVAGTNVVEIAWRLDGRTGRLIVLSALDNLVKGASGQAVQSMNILCGFPETAGLI